MVACRPDQAGRERAGSRCSGRGAAPVAGGRQAEGSGLAGEPR